MNNFDKITKPIADKLINLSGLLENKMETWADVFARHPDSQNVGITAGFISDQKNHNRLEVVIDVLTPRDTTYAELRTRAIETVHDDKGNERFNSILLTFRVDRDRADQLVKEGKSIQREPMRELLHAEKSQLSHILVSDNTGRDEALGNLLGKRYDFDANELRDLPDGTVNELTEALNSVLNTLTQAASHEANA